LSSWEWQCSHAGNGLAGVVFFLFTEVVMASEAKLEKTVLVVEDDAIACKGLSAILEKEGYHVVTAEEGRQALKRLREGLVPDIILLDMLMPVHDGWQFCYQKQRDKTIAPIPVVIMTGLGIASDEWASSLGATALLHKPIDVPDLVETVRSCSNRPQREGRN
jgi:CheY-like chemotaxis protein